MVDQRLPVVSSPQLSERDQGGPTVDRREMLQQMASLVAAGQVRATDKPEPYLSVRVNSMTGVNYFAPQGRVVLTANKMHLFLMNRPSEQPYRVPMDPALALYMVSRVFNEKFWMVGSRCDLNDQLRVSVQGDPQGAVISLTAKNLLSEGDVGVRNSQNGGPQLPEKSKLAQILKKNEGELDDIVKAYNRAAGPANGVANVVLGAEFDANRQKSLRLVPDKVIIIDFVKAPSGLSGEKRSGTSK